jgi:hypothetical protein
VSPDARQHRGAHPADEILFAPAQWPALRTATAELSWLLSRGYAIKAALKLVGDQHALRERQRAAVARAACSDASRAQRAQTCVATAALDGANVVIDGFNLIVTLEAALGGGPLILSRDGCLRDLSSVYGSYRSVLETDAVVELIGESLSAAGVKAAHWLLDRPISNSGRLAARIRTKAAERGWPWTVELAFNPDALVREAAAVALTSDSAILDAVARWHNLAAHLYARGRLRPWLIDLRV